ncbi:MAG: PTS sugar transporter subunit IIB, partial [Candidatus Delongbacteria bacterium]
ELYLLGVPDGVKGAAIPVSEVKNYLGKLKKASYILVLSSIQDALRLLESGFEYTELNIGGMHDSEGRHEINHYVFLLEEDIKALEELMKKGVRITVQDLPTNRKYDAEYIMNKWKI